MPAARDSPSRPGLSVAAPEATAASAKPIPAGGLSSRSQASSGRPPGGVPSDPIV